MSRFRAVIFDFGGVFTTSPVENFAAFERARGLPDRFIGGVIKARLDDGAFAQFERAEIGVDEFCRLFAEETRAAGYEIAGHEFLPLLDVALKPEMIEAHRRIRNAGLLTGCITNNFPHGKNDGGAPSGAAAAGVLAAFDHVIESSKAGVRKPERKIYEMMVDALGVEARACIFIDDLGVNLKPAQAMGMATIKAPFGDITPAINELSALLGLRLRD